MKYIISLLATIILLGCSAEDYTDKDSNYERKMYIVQNGTEKGVLKKTVNADEAFESSISLYCSGIQNNQEIQITLDEDLEKFESIKEGADEDYQRLPEGALTINKQVVIKAKEWQTMVSYNIKSEMLHDNVTYLWVIGITSATNIEVDSQQNTLAISFEKKQTNTL